MKQPDDTLTCGLCFMAQNGFLVRGVLHDIDIV